MVNMGRTAVTIGLLWNRGLLPVPWEENAFYTRSRRIPAAVSPTPDTPAGWRVVILPAPAVLPRFSREILPLPCKTLFYSSRAHTVSKIVEVHNIKISSSIISTDFKCMYRNSNVSIFKTVLLYADTAQCTMARLQGKVGVIFNKQTGLWGSAGLKMPIHGQF